MKDNIVFQNYKNRKIMIKSRKLISTSTGIVTGNKKGTYYMSVMRHYDDGEGVKNYVLLQYRCPGYEKVEVLYKKMDDKELEKLVDKLEDKTKFISLFYPGVW
jgi:hypothetical protein